MLHICLSLISFLQRIQERVSHRRQRSLGPLVPLLVANPCLHTYQPWLQCFFKCFLIWLSQVHRADERQRRKTRLQVGTPLVKIPFSVWLVFRPTYRPTQRSWVAFRNHFCCRLCTVEDPGVLVYVCPETKSILIWEPWSTLFDRIQRLENKALTSSELFQLSREDGRWGGTQADLVLTFSDKVSHTRTVRR